MSIARSTSPWIVNAGIAGNASIVALWLVTRTVGMPFGPARGMPEHVHAPDALATALEVVVVVAGFMILEHRAGGRLLAAAAVAGSFVSVAVSGHDAARERATALATLLLAGALRALVAVAPDLLASIWRRHEAITLARRVPARVVSPARAGVGARG